MEGAEVPPREIQILETPEDIQERREQVLGRYVQFKESTRLRRERLEDARRYMYFKRDADELESWINEKLQTASDESYRDPTNLQVKLADSCILCRRSKNEMHVGILYHIFIDKRLHEIFSLDVLCSVTLNFYCNFRPRYRNTRPLRQKLLPMLMLL